MFNNFKVIFCNHHVLFGKCYDIFENLFSYGWIKLYYIKLNKEAFWILHYRFEPVYNRVCVFPLFNIQSFHKCLINIFQDYLLILPSSDLHGFIEQHRVTDLKFCLWSFNVTNALFFVIHSIRSSRLMFFCNFFCFEVDWFFHLGWCFPESFRYIVS